jgi:hypothetical protein
MIPDESSNKSEPFPTLLQKRFISFLLNPGTQAGQLERALAL